MEDCALKFSVSNNEGYLGKEVVKIRNSARNVVKCGKYNPANLANLYTFVLRADLVTKFGRQFTHVIQKYTNLATLKGYILRILQHFSAKLCSCTQF